MERTCPKCNRHLPDVETLKYRYCPHCGSEIAAKPRPLDEASLTIPPDLPSPPEKPEANNRKPDVEHKRTDAGSFDDHTIAPQAVRPEKRPQIKPPAEPPPPSFFRKPAAEPDLPPSTLKKQTAAKVDPPPPEPKKQPPPKNHTRIIIAVLIILVLAILILGGVFTF